MNSPIRESAFPYYENIDDFLSTFTSLRSKRPSFFCLRINGSEDKVIYKPPFRKGFYSIVLISNATTYKLYVDNNEIKTNKSFLVFQSPGHLISYRYKVDAEMKGYLIFFKPEIFSFLKKDFGQEFLFLDQLHNDSFELKDSQLELIENSFREVFLAYKNDETLPEMIAPLKLLALVHTIKQFTQKVANENENLIAEGNGNEILFNKFFLLVNKYFLEKRTVKEYANLLCITPDYLSSLIKKHSNKNALTFINTRIVNEAKSFLLYTDHNISEVAIKLNFSDTSNFVKFFKSKTGYTPVEFKKHSAKEVIYNDI